MNQARKVLAQTLETLETGAPVVMIQVLSVRGSTPREAGALMMVSSQQQAGTIGGGELEHQAIQQARALLEQTGQAPEERPMQRQFALGSNCGQCCGGAVTLSFRRLSAMPEDLQAQLDTLQASAKVALFGAGHVGTAVADVLTRLDVDILWVDQRAKLLARAASQIDSNNVVPAPHPRPAEFAARIPAGTLCLVMTHDHGLDFDICTRLLSREDIPFCGLIGSLSKRRRFERRWREAGVAPALARLTCPIGIAGINGKSPYEIAVAVSAQLLQHIDASTREVSATPAEAVSAALSH